jgi:hypothetical protein
LAPGKLCSVSYGFGGTGGGDVGSATKVGPTVDTVLGVSITSTSLGWVLADDSASDGATLDHDAFDVDAGDPSPHAVAVRGAQAIAAATGHEIRAIGITWTEDAEADAGQLLESLESSGYDNLVKVQLTQAALAWAQREGCELGNRSTAVCVIEPAAVTVFAGDINVTHARDSASADGLSRWLIEVLSGTQQQPGSLLLVGSRSDRDELTDTLDAALPMPVIGTAEVQLVLARGAALALLNVITDSTATDEETDDDAVDDDPPHGGGSWLASHSRALIIAAAG